MYLAYINCILIICKIQVHQGEKKFFLSDAAFPPRPKRPVVLQRSKEYSLKWFVSGSSSVNGYIVQSKYSNGNSSSWKRLAKVKKHGSESDNGVWKKILLTKNQATEHQFRIISYNDEGLSEPSQSSRPMEKEIEDFAKYRPKEPFLFVLESGNIVVSWKPPEQWKMSKNFVLVVELLSDEEIKKVNKNPYGASGECNTFKKEFSDGDEDGFVRLEIDKKIVKKDNIKKVRVKILNLDYESSLYSKEVRIDNMSKRQKTTDERMKHRHFEKLNIKHLENKSEIAKVHHDITRHKYSENTAGNEDVPAESVKDMFEEYKDNDEKVERYLEVQKHPEEKMYLAKVDPGFVDELDKFVSDKDRDSEQNDRPNKPEERHTASHYLFMKHL